MESKISEEVYGSALSVLSNDPTGEMERLLGDIAQWSKKNSPQTPYDGFEWYQVHGDARTLNSLVTKRILEIRLKTNKSTTYRVVNLEALERALNDYQGISAPLAEEEPEIPPDLFSIIVGHQDKKDILKRCIFSDQPVHALLWGSIASAKTLMLEELSRLPRNKFILGSSLSKAGLYEILFNEKPKFLIIDELDKIDDAENLSALLSLMERGFISETKYRRHRKLRLKTWVFSSANRIDRTSPELLSRFLKLRFSDYSDPEFFEVTVIVLTEREKITSSLAAYIADKTLKVLGSRDVRDAVRISRLLKDLDRKEVDHIIGILQKQK